MNIGDTVLNRDTWEVVTIIRCNSVEAVIETAGGYIQCVPIHQLEPGYDLQPDIERLPSVRLATLNGEVV